jgi:hypothetical protein
MAPEKPILIIKRHITHSIIRKTSDEPSGQPSEKSMVGRGRLELPTSRLSGVRSNQLSYRPDKALALE